MRKAKFLAELKGRRFRLIPRCVITQANGKQRIIDDAARGGQSELSADQNKLVLCTPLRPAQHIAAVAAAMPEELWSYCRHSDRWLGAGEDWPQAYRHSPISFDEALACVVVFWHDEWQEPAFQIYSSLLFGPPLAVTSFNRYSRFAEALGRRLLRCLVPMYNDDAHLTDLESNGKSSQWSFGVLNAVLGTPFAEEKPQPLSDKGTFLGLDYDFTEVGSHAPRIEGNRDDPGCKVGRGADGITGIQALWYFELP